MKQHNKKQYAGVWLDGDKAVIIAHASETEGGDYATQHTIKAPEQHGGGGSEHSMNNAKKSAALKFYKTISTQLVAYDEILIFGPGTAQEEFHHHLQEDAQFKGKQITVDSAERLSDAQMIAKVRDFFKSHQA